MLLELAAESEVEFRLLSGLVDDPMASAPARDYADWLEASGDLERATCLRQFSRFLRGTAGLPDQQHGSPAWRRMIGLTLAQELSAAGFSDRVSEWLPLARPALPYSTSPATDAEIPPGRSKLGGLPDLKSGTRWPTRADCTQHWDDAPELDPSAPCAFVGQFNLAELAGSQGARVLPGVGLLSVFAHTETEEVGTVSSLLLHTTDLGDLARLTPPELDEVNATSPTLALTFRETLDLPEPRGPWSDRLALGDQDWATHEGYRAARIRSGNALCGLLGFGWSTTGGDPTPDRSSRSFLTVRTDGDGGSCLHLFLTAEDLAAGRLETAELLWMDWD